MSTGGRVVARGTVLVDPRKAVDKLRAHLLPSPELYVLEIVRVACGGGATRIDVAQDADDLVITFDGDAVPTSELERLLDHLFGAASHRMRLLAIAVNTALALEPKWVDVWTTRFEHPAGWIGRARFRATSEGGAPQIEAVERPAGFPAHGMRLHVRSGFAGALARLAAVIASEDERREIEALKPRMPLLSVPVLIHGKRLVGRSRPPLLASVPLTPLRDGIRGELGLAARSIDRGQIDLAELGVLVERRALPIPASRDGSEWPLFAWIDAKELPTNAARSRVETGGAFDAAVERAIGATVQRLVHRSLELVQTRASEGGDAARAATRDALFSLVVGALGATWPECAAVAGSAVDPISGEPPRAAQPVLAVPTLLFDATLDALFDAPIVPLASGDTTSLRALATEKSRGSPPRVWLETEPLDAEIAEWLAPVVWARPSDPGLVSCTRQLEAIDARPEVETFALVRTKYRRWLAHPPSVPRVGQVDRRRVVLRVSFEGDVRGEAVVLLAAPDRGDPGGTSVTFYRDGRPLGTEARMDGASPLLVRIAVESARLKPGPLFEGVAYDDALVEAVRAAYAPLADAIEAALGAAPEGALALGGIALAATGAAALARLAMRLRVICGAAVSPALRRVRAWHVAADAELATTDEALEVLEGARDARFIAFVDPATAFPGSPPYACRVLVVDAVEQRTLSSIAGAPLEWIDCGPFLPIRPTPRGSLRRPPDVEAPTTDGIWLEETGARVAAWPVREGEGALFVYHSGVLVQRHARAGRVGPVWIAVEDDALVPRPDAPLSEIASELVARAELELAAELVQADQWSPAERRFLLHAAATPDAVSAEVRAKLDGLPLMRVGGARGAVHSISPREMRQRAARAGGSLPFVAGEVPTNLEEGDEPIYFTTEELADRTLVERALSARLYDGAAELERKQRAREERRIREMFERCPRGSLDALDGPISGPVHRLATGGGDVAIALASGGGAGALVEILLEHRIVVAIPTPSLGDPLHRLFRARISLWNRSMLTPALDGLTEQGRALVERALDAGLLAILRGLVERAEQGDVGAEARQLVLQWVRARAHRDAGASSDDPIASALAGARLWPAQLGGLVSARACAAIAREHLPVTTAVFAEWLPPTTDAPDSPVIAIPASADAAAWMSCLAALAGVPAVDVADDLRRIQAQRRVLTGRALDISLGPAEPDTLGGRIEELAPSLGAGEVRLVAQTPGAAPSLHVLLHVEGVCEARVDLPAPIAVVAALETPLYVTPAAAIDPIAADLANELLVAARALLESALERGETIPDALGPTWRWYVLSTPDAHERARAMPLFRDTMRAPIAMHDLTAQERDHGAIAYVTEEPPSPVSPGDAGRRVVVLSSDDASAAARGGAAWIDYAETLRDEASARAFEAQSPVADIRVRDAVTERAPRFRLELDPHGATGEVVLARPTGADAIEIEWHWTHRALRDRTRLAPRPCAAIVAVEAPDVAPNAARSGPIEGDAYAAALERVPEWVEAAARALLGPPPGVLASVTITRRHGKRFGGNVIGSVWLTEPGTSGTVVAHSVDGATRKVAPSILSQRTAAIAVPIAGTVLEQTRDAASQLWWRALLAELLTKAIELVDDEAHADAALGHLAWAAVNDVLSAPMTSQRRGVLAEWATQTRLPGSAATFADVADAARRQAPLIAVVPGTRGLEHDRGLVARANASWFRQLVRAGIVAGAIEPVDSNLTIRSSRPPPAAPPRTAADDVQDLLARWGIHRYQVALDPRGRGSVKIEHAGRRATIVLCTAHPTVGALVGERSERSLRILACLALGALNRALEPVTDEAELAALDFLLEHIPRGGERSR